MKSVNTHSLKMRGLRAVSRDTKGLQGYYDGRYIQVNYDITTGEIWGNYHCSFGQNSWSVYDDPDVIVVGNVCNPCTMQQIADMIADAVSYNNE